MPRPPKEQEEWQITPLARLKQVLPTPRKKFLSPALEITAAVAGLLFAVTFFGPAEYNLQGAGVRAALAPAPAGRTVVEIPPLGTITLKTHSTPLEIRLTLKDIRPELFRQDFDLSSADGLIDSFLPAAKKAAFLFAAREIFLGGCGAALALFLLRRASLKRCLSGAAAAALFLAAFFAATGLTFYLATLGLRKGLAGLALLSVAHGLLNYGALSLSFLVPGAELLIEAFVALVSAGLTLVLVAVMRRHPVKTQEDGRQ